MILVDGVEQRSSFDIKTSIKPEAIKSINVLQGKAATDKYGDKGKFDVIEIHTKD